MNDWYHLITGTAQMNQNQFIYLGIYENFVFQWVGQWYFFTFVQSTLPIYAKMIGRHLSYHGPIDYYYAKLTFRNKNIKLNRTNKKKRNQQATNKKEKKNNNKNNNQIPKPMCLK